MLITIIVVLGIASVVICTNTFKSIRLLDNYVMNSSFMNFIRSNL